MVYRLFNNYGSKYIWVSVLLILLHFAYGISYGAEILFIDNTDSGLITQKQLYLASTFYGLKKDTFLMNSDKRIYYLMNHIMNVNNKWIILSAVILENLNHDETLKLVRMIKKTKKNVLIMGITASTPKNVLNALSSGVIRDCDVLFNDKGLALYKIAKNQSDVTAELSGQEYRLETERSYYFAVDNKFKDLTIMGIMDNNIILPNFIRIKSDGQEIFFLADMVSHEEKEIGYEWQYNSARFVEIAPLMMYLKYSCAEYCWHSIDDYANFIIDDPWLTEPYGYLSYESLLHEMENANFHTTIAFIPWNYDRSEQEVTEILKKNRNRYSIIIHGNNHNHAEFDEVKKTSEDHWPKKAFAEQSEDIKQAVARMDKFNELTNLKYDRVMVFPHKIASEMALLLLKQYNFLATVNGSNLPAGMDTPRDITNILRPVTIKYSNFPSMKRYSPSLIKPSEIARELFFDNPIVFYGHHDYFEKGINAFNKTALIVNKIQPEIKWQSMGDIIRHMYYLKLRDDGNYDVKMIANEIVFENVHNRKVEYYIRKEETNSPSIKSVLVDGKPYPYDIQENELEINLTLYPQAVISIIISYENDFDPKNIDISKKNLNILILRILSDFRDLTLSKYKLGRIFTYYFYESGMFKYGLISIVAIIVIISIICYIGVKKILKRNRY